MDRGPGIPSKDTLSLFKKFGNLGRLGEHRCCNEVGLATVKHIIDQHHGDITIKSRVGEGLVFTVRIPIIS